MERKLKKGKSLIIENKKESLTSTSRLLKKLNSDIFSFKNNKLSRSSTFEIHSEKEISVFIIIKIDNYC